MKTGVWIVFPILLLGVSACSGDSAPAVDTATATEVSTAGLEGVEFIVHQVPG